MQEAAKIDNRVIKMGIDSDDHVETALVNMYVKCSNTENAHNVFDKMPNNAGSWNALVTVYAEIGHANEALALFHQMQRVGMKPDSIKMLRVLPEMCPFGSSTKCWADLGLHH